MKREREREKRVPSGESRQLFTRQQKFISLIGAQAQEHGLISSTEQLMFSGESNALL